MAEMLHVRLVSTFFACHFCHISPLRRPRLQVGARRFRMGSAVRNQSSLAMSDREEGREKVGGGAVGAGSGRGSAGGGAEGPEWSGQAGGRLLMGPLLVGGTPLSGGGPEGPEAQAGGGDLELEVTVHSLNRQLQARAAGVFPDAPTEHDRLLALVTWQRASCDLVPWPGAPSSPQVPPRPPASLPPCLAYVPGPANLSPHCSGS